MMSQHHTAIGIDLGATMIKAACVDTRTGDIVGERATIPMPADSPVDEVIALANDLVTHFTPTLCVGLAVPARVRDMAVQDATNVDNTWVGTTIDDWRPMLATAMINDADAVGLAEARFGDDTTYHSKVALTFGTGIGSSLISGSVVVVDTEFGILSLDGRRFEDVAAGSVVTRLHLTGAQWAEIAQPYFDEIERILAPTHIIVSGGLTERYDDYFSLLSTQAKLHESHFGQDAGVVGAAIAATMNAR